MLNLSELITIFFSLKDLPVKNPGLLEDVSQVDVGVQKVGVQCHRLLEVVDGEPDLSLGVEHAPKVAPSHGEVRTCLDSFQITRLFFFWHLKVSWKKKRKGGKERKEKKSGVSYGLVNITNSVMGMRFGDRMCASRQFKTRLKRRRETGGGGFSIRKKYNNNCGANNKWWRNNKGKYIMPRGKLFSFKLVANINARCCCFTQNLDFRALPTHWLVHMGL